MRFTHFVFANVLAILVGSMLWSCNNDSRGLSPTASPRPAIQPPPMAMAAGGMQKFLAGCPMALRGADVAVSDTEEGVALSFKADPSDIAVLRSRVRSMSKVYEMQQGHGAMMWQPKSGEGVEILHMAGLGPMPATEATVTDTDKGASIEFRPTYISQLDVLRQHVRLHQQRMRSGECWILQEQPPAEGGQE